MKSVTCTKSNPSVIRWARTSLNVDATRAASVADVSLETLAEFESGGKSPTLAELRKLANLYKRPIATFFLSTPPAAIAEPKDFRTKKGPLTRETLLSIRRARAVQYFVSQLGETSKPVFWRFHSDPKISATAARDWNYSAGAW